MKKWIQRTRYYPFNVVFVVGAGFGDVTGTGVGAGVGIGVGVGFKILPVTGTGEETFR